MITEIGFVAGDIWRILDEKGSMKLSKVIKQVSHPEDLTLMAVGWLCREGHVTIVEKAHDRILELRKRNV
ncbi:MAG TPA: hypothetical protein DIS66_00225 [Candidatus Omnitrophica bacterium]|nr:hypothetical protein [Candidatus Omnitrophota bacterium]